MAIELELLNFSSNSAKSIEPCSINSKYEIKHDIKYLNDHIEFQNY